MAASLHDRIKAEIAAGGPMPLERYMALCLHDEAEGYYRRREAIGAAGDFVTAPEISQIFGELIGLWSVTVWQQMGAPERVRLVELGPGRGTLLSDALRAARLVPPFLAAVELDLVETSAVLRAKQAEQLAMYRPHWHEDIATVPAGPAIIIGNEFLDALPVRQWVRDGARWRERAVGLAGDRLVFTTLPAAGRPPEVPAAVDEAPNGAIFETRPGLAGLAAAMSERARQAPIAALFIDYGHGAHALGDTLQAVRAHAAADPLAGPGTADLSTQVDFAAVAAEMQARGLLVDGPMLQAEFLGRLGLIERAQRLMAGIDAVTAGRIEAGALRLVDPAGMGSRFKAVGIRSPGLSRLPPF